MKDNRQSIHANTEHYIFYSANQLQYNMKHNSRASIEEQVHNFYILNKHLCYKDINIGNMLISSKLQEPPRGLI